MNIVSGFISNINRRSDRDITKYLKFGFELMAVEIPMTIFIEREVFEKHIIGHLGVGSGSLLEDAFVYRVCGGVMDGIQQKYSYVRIGHITFVFFRICDLFLWYYREMASKFILNTGNPTKDTLEYMMVQCQKSEWMAIASQLHSRFNRARGLGVLSAIFRRCDSGASNENEYVWIDFGVFHMFQGKIDVFQTELYKMRSRIHCRKNDLLRRTDTQCLLRSAKRQWSKEVEDSIPSLTPVGRQSGNTPIQEPECSDEKKNWSIPGSTTDGSQEGNSQEQLANHIPSIDQLRKMNINQLKTIASQIGITSDVTKLKKPELISLIQTNSN